MLTLTTNNCKTSSKRLSRKKNSNLMSVRAIALIL